MSGKFKDTQAGVEKELGIEVSEDFNFLISKWYILWILKSNFTMSHVYLKLSAIGNAIAKL